jgi:hypothetical protein
MSDQQPAKTKIGRFDQVKILTTKNVSYLSAPPNTKVSPKGMWSVSSVVDGDLLLVKQSTLIRIPASDVLLVIGYDIQKITKNLGKLSHGKVEKHGRAG